MDNFSSVLMLCSHWMQSNSQTEHKCALALCLSDINFMSHFCGGEIIMAICVRMKSESLCLEA